MPPSTFSLVARDQSTGDIGVAVHSKTLAVGAVVPSAAAGVGAIATQAWANVAYGHHVLRLLSDGWTAEEAVAQVTAMDGARARRQVGIVDAQGRAAAFTGDQCLEWAGHVVGRGYCCQGNLLAGPQVVEAMASTFESLGGGLWDRLLAALSAGQAAGGDRRGQQSAALLVVRSGSRYDGRSDRFIDLRVDDHPRPIDELARLLELQKLYLLPTLDEDLLPIDRHVAAELVAVLRAAGYQLDGRAEYGPEQRRALRELVGRENLEVRWHEGQHVDRAVLHYLREKFA